MITTKKINPLTDIEFQVMDIIWGSGKLHGRHIYQNHYIYIRLRAHKSQTE